MPKRRAKSGKRKHWYVPAKHEPYHVPIIGWFAGMWAEIAVTGRVRVWTKSTDWRDATPEEAERIMAERTEKAA